MNESMRDGYQIRFCREGTPYFEDFELAVSTLLNSQKEKNPFINTTIDLMKVIQKHLGECQALLSKTEKMIEEIRANNGPQDEIEKLAALCRDQQKMQVELAEDVVTCINVIVDSIFPR